MKNKGFTLIELLAVIVILAIIALIATPIILGIINDAREATQKRSIELYRVSVANAVAAEAMRHPNHKIVGEFKSSANGRQLLDGNTPILFIDYEGSKVSCEIVRVYEDGKVEVDRCMVDDVPVGFTPATNDVPQYYAFTENLLNTGSSLIADINKTSSTDYSNLFPYLGYKVNGNGIIEEIYNCFKMNGTEHCFSRSELLNNSETQITNKISSIFSGNPNYICTSPEEETPGYYYCRFGNFSVEFGNEEDISLTIRDNSDCASSYACDITVEGGYCEAIDHPDDCECEGCDEDPEECYDPCYWNGSSCYCDPCEIDPDSCDNPGGDEQIACEEGGGTWSEESWECYYDECEGCEDNPDDECWYCENEDDPESCYSIC